MAGESRSVARVVAALVMTSWLVGVAPVLLGGRTFAAEPHLASTLPWFDRMASAIGDGHLPEWDDASGLGAAVALEGGRPLCYPPAWVVGALPRPWGTDALALAHLLLFGLGAAAWARRLGADPLGAVVAGGGASLSVAATGALTAGAAVCAAAWLPWVGWAADRMAAHGRGDRGRALLARALALAVVLAGLVLAGGATGAALAAPVVAGAAIAIRAPGAARAWLGLAAASAAALLLSAAAWMPAALAGALRLPPGAAAGLDLEPAEILALLLALAGVVAGPAAVRRAAAAAIALAVLAGMVPVSSDGFPAALAALVYPLAGLGASAAARALGRLERLQPAGPAVAALIATAAIGPLAARAWRLPLEDRDRVAEPPALLARAVEDAAAADAPPSAAPTASARAPVTASASSRAAAPPTASSAAPPSRRGDGGGPGPRRRIAWPEHTERGYRDAPPEAGARFGFAYVPGRDRGRDPELAALWRASSGAGKRLLDLFDVEYAVVPATVAVPAAMAVVGTSSSGERVLVESGARRPRAFVATRWSWHAEAEALRRDLFPVAPDQRGALSLGEVRLSGAGVPPPARGARPALPCAIESARPERVSLVCRSGAGGYAVLLDRAAPGWSARVDGEEAAIVTADLLVRAVAVPPGRHRIDFEYRTPGLRLGAILAGAAWLNALALALLLRRLGKTAPTV